MPGVKGAGGPVPKRADQRRRANEPDVPVVSAPAFKAEPPDADPDWHPVAKRWFESLARSGQAAFYEESDWLTAVVLAESMSREFEPQPMMVGKGEDAHFEMVKLPPKSASISAWIKGFTSLLATEGDRRRARIELEAPKVEETDGDVSWLDDARRRASSTA
jgi:hypothetical protein